jgi:hypothetical protein
MELYELEQSIMDQMYQWKFEQRFHQYEMVLKAQRPREI